MIEFWTRPGDSRAFIHRRIGRGLKSFVTSGFNPVAAAGAFFTPSDQPRRRLTPRGATARPSARGAAQQARGRAVKFGGTAVEFRGLSRATAATAGCGFGQKIDPATGLCAFFLGSGPGIDILSPSALEGGISAALPGGEVVMGRYGAGMVPGSKIIDKAICIPGMLLGDDGVCYNKSQIKNSERQWPRGRRPLLTGGEMRSIAIAARAAGRLERTSKRLQKIGLLKKPVRRN